MRSLSFVLALLIVGTSSFDASSLSAQRKPRENDLKLPIGGTPGDEAERIVGEGEQGTAMDAA